MMACRGPAVSRRIATSGALRLSCRRTAFFRASFRVDCRAEFLPDLLKQGTQRADVVVAVLGGRRDFLEHRHCGGRYPDGFVDTVVRE